MFDLETDWERFCNNDYSDNTKISHKIVNKNYAHSLLIDDMVNVNDNLKSLDNDINDSDEDNSSEMVFDFIELNKNINEYELNNNSKNIPKSSEIYISTKTKISYLSQPIDLKETFWKIPISPYHTPKECIIKKQMKFNSISEDEITYINEKLKQENYWNHHIITRIVNPDGRIKYKDIRKINVGLCKKDILSYRTKKKSAFYNCFVLIMRVLHNDVFKEIHIKVFNTGKLEIPGIQTDDLLIKVLNLLISILKPIINENINYISEKTQTVLINSNFHCGFFINREKLYEILKYKYHINSCYDPCSYPGIQCKIFYDNNYNNDNITKIFEYSSQSHDLKKLNYNKISFMIFRTGSVLIVGKCKEDILYELYRFIDKLLKDEYKNIVDTTTLLENNENNISKKKKIRKKIILL